MSKVNLEYYCCEIIINCIHLNFNFQHIVSHLEHLNIASHKVSDAERIIEEHEWKRTHHFPKVFCVNLYFLHIN
jgi:hypothetical protein